MLIALILAAALGPEDSVRQAVLASVAAEWKGAAPFLCVDVVSPPADRGTKFWHIRLVGTDPSAKAFPRLDDDLPAMVPRSACTVGAEYDGSIVLRATPKTGGATVSLGPVSWLNGEDARIVVLTWAGGLSHTFAEWKVQKENGAWLTRGSSIILQE